jgi:hypothetical protein
VKMLEALTLGDLSRLQPPRPEFDFFLHT